MLRQPRRRSPPLMLRGERAAAGESSSGFPIRAGTVSLRPITAAGSREGRAGQGGTGWVGSRLFNPSGCNRRSILMALLGEPGWDRTNDLLIKSKCSTADTSRHVLTLSVADPEISLVLFVSS